MFDLTAGTIDRPFRDQHASATAFSAAMHVAVVGVAFWFILFSVGDQLPEVPSMMAFIAEAPSPSPPPPPPPAAPKALKAVQASKPVSTSGPTFIAPAEVPIGIQAENGLDLGDEGGVVGGVEGGIPGGVLGGILGGMVREAPPPPPPPTPPKPVRVGGDLKAPALIHRVEPEYPFMAVSAKVTGIVILEATVDEAGRVTDVKVLRSVPLLESAATKAVKQWRYAPLLLNGSGIPFILTVTLTFSIK